MTHPVNAYVALGGHPGLRRAVEQFTELVLGDPTVAVHFEASDPGAWRWHQLEVLAAAVGGPQRNSAANKANPPEAERLTDAEFKRVLIHLKAALVEVGADERAIRGVIKAASQTRDLIVLGPETNASPHTPRKDMIMTSGIDEPEDVPTLYPVAEVAGHDPASLDDFLGATTVTVETHGRRQDLLGAGTRAGQSVLFFPRDEVSVGEEVAVWRISEESTGHIVAQPSDQSDWTSAPATGALRDRED